eukprot:8761333-Pyramimonas_sp.AAC.1
MTMTEGMGDEDSEVDGGIEDGEEGDDGGDESCGYAEALLGNLGVLSESSWALLGRLGSSRVLSGHP